MDKKGKLKEKKGNCDTDKKQTTKILMAFLGGLMVGAIITPFTLSTETSNIKNVDEIVEDEVVTDSVEVEDKKAVGITDVTINVENQVAGSIVSIDRVVSSTGGWIVIRNNTYGTPGNVIGTQHFDAGMFDGTVKLLRNTRIGNIYYAVLYNDNGDGIFNLRTDKPIVDSASNVIADTFVTIPHNQ